MARWLNRRGIFTRLRNSAGQDVDGGCGQLRARAAGTDGAPAATKVRFHVEPGQRPNGPPSPLAAGS